MSTKNEKIHKKTTTKKTAAKPDVKTTAPRKTAAAKTKTPAKKTAAKAAPQKKPSKATFKKQLTAQLLESKDKILQEVSQKIKSESNVLKREIGDIYDLASSERERELTLTLGDRDRKKLAEIDAALDRINDNTYGECEECGEPIKQGRLQALPFTRVCVECQSSLEREIRIKGRVEEEPGLGIVEKSESEDEEF
jgi:DnaK suppressor protein